MQRWLLGHWESLLQGLAQNEMLGFAVQLRHDHPEGQFPSPEQLVQCVPVPTHCPLEQVWPEEHGLRLVHWRQLPTRSQRWGLPPLQRRVPSEEQVLEHDVVHCPAEHVCPEAQALRRTHWVHCPTRSHRSGVLPSHRRVPWEHWLEQLAEMLSCRGVVHTPPLPSAPARTRQK